MSRFNYKNRLFMPFVNTYEHLRISGYFILYCGGDEGITPN